MQSAPESKGKVEAGVKYVQNNGLAGRQFDSLSAQNLFLSHWEQTVADTRIHGTTRQQVRTLFLNVEKPKLVPLPSWKFNFWKSIGMNNGLDHIFGNP